MALSETVTFSSKPDQVLVVPPMALAWLTESECSKTVITFEARGHSDATVLLSSHRCAGRLSSSASNYTVIIGSHRNSCVKIEKNGVVVCQVQTRGRSASPAGSATSSPVKSRKHQLHPMQLDPDVFRPFWVSYDRGEICIGHGEDHGDAFCAWKDVLDSTADVPGGVTGGHGRIQHVGLSSWNTHVGYRNVHVKTVDGDSMAASSDADDGKGQRMSVIAHLQSLTHGLDDEMECDVQSPQLSESAEVAMSLVETCMDTMKNAVDLERVCEYLTGLDRLTNQQHRSNEVFLRTRDHCIAFAATHIEDLYMECREALCALPSCVMEAIVKHQAIPCSETVVFDVVRSWYGENGPDDTGAQDETKNTIALRESYKLLRHVRFPLMTGKELESLTSSGMSAVSSNSALLAPTSAWSDALADLLQEAVEYHKDCKNTNGLNDPSIFIDGILDGKLPRLPSDTDGPLRFRERSPSGCIHLVYMYDGDNNGVFQFVGTRYGTASWANPVAAGLVSISSSSPLGRFCDPRALVGRSFSSLNFAGPRRSIYGGVESWWAIDLRHGLRCTRYAVRHDGSSDHLRNWVFQGSSDGTSWVTLDEHINDTTIRMPGQWASWAVRDGRRRAFRHFRILLTAPNAAAPNPMHLSLDHVEMYGDLYLHAAGKMS